MNHDVSYRKLAENEDDYQEKGFMENLSSGRSGSFDLGDSELTVALLGETEGNQADDDEPTELGHKFYVEDTINAMGWGRFQIMVCIVCGMGSTSEAMEMMILSILSPALHCEWGVSSKQQAFVTTSVFVGMMVGAASWGLMCDRYGRKPAVLLSFFVTFHFGFLSSFSPDITWVYILRGIIGFAIIGGSQTSTLLIEFTPAQYRTYLQAMGFFWAVGNIFVIITAIVVMPNLGWRWQLALCASPVLVASIIIWVLLPESIRFQVTHGDFDGAVKTIKRMARLNKKPMPKGELHVHRTPGKHVRVAKWKDLLNIRLRRTTLTLGYIWFAAAFSYYGVSLLNTELMKEEKGCPTSSRHDVESDCTLDCAQLTSADYGRLLISSISEVLAVPLSVILTKYASRRRTLGVLYVLFAVFTALLMLCISKTVVTITMLGVRTCCATMFTMLYLYTLEVYPTSLRGTGLGTCSSMARVGGIITPFISQVLLQTSFHGTVITYTVVGFFAGVAAFSLPTETKDVEIEDY